MTDRPSRFHSTPSREACAPERPKFKRRAALLALAALLAPLLTAPQSALAEPEETAPVTIVALGDSLTQGYGLPAAEGFVPQLEAWLKANGAAGATVINAGASGDTTSGGLARLDWSVGPEADAVILELGANDALRGGDVPLALTRDNLDQMLARLKERGLPVLLVGMRAPGNWGRDYKQGFDAMYPELAEKHGALLYPFFLAGLTDDLDGAKVDRSLFQPNDFHPSAKGVAKIVARIGPAVLELVAAARAAQD